MYVASSRSGLRLRVVYSQKEAESKFMPPNRSNIRISSLHAKPSNLWNSLNETYSKEI